jgi:thiol-disulfide isomerase/thioredoxin
MSRRDDSQSTAIVQAVPRWTDAARLGSDALLEESTVTQMRIMLSKGLVASLGLLVPTAASAQPQSVPPTAPVEMAGTSQRALFSRAVVNLEYAVYALRSAPKRALRSPNASLPLYFGSIARRYPDEEAASSEHFVAYAVEFDSLGAVRAWCDQNFDNDLTNDPPLRLDAHPRSPSARSFLVDLRWIAPLAWRQHVVDEKVRVVLERSPDGGTPQARVQRVYGMLGWAVFEGTRRRIALFDGNGDGLYSSAFGDGMFVDGNGDGHFEIEQMSEEFIPFRVPVPFGGRRYRVASVEPVGRWLELEDLGPVPPVAAARVGEPAPLFEALSSEGAALRLADHRGQWTILYFWASWCGTCIAQAPELGDIVRRFASRGLDVLGVSYDTDRAKMAAFRSTYQETWPTTFSGRMLWEDPVGRLYAIDGPGVMCLITPDLKLEGKYEDTGDLRARLVEIFGDVGGRWQNATKTSTEGGAR